MLKILNTKEVHISTIEDPVEYDIEGISQIQVNHRKGITFAAGLKAIVRQDPDIIMVGEIRDQETADIAVNSAMTGHLVISTMHANDAPTTFIRLIDMGVEPFLVASTVKLVIAQRLVRRICKKCLISYQLTEAEKDVVRHYPELLKILQAKGYGNLDKIRLYKGEGCQACAQTGYQGRIGIFEVLEMTENIKKAIIDRASASQILSIARADGLTTILEDGVDKAFSGITTLSEVLRVAR
jgi:type II secretory ATPase GspE/PulE/Tfp pilus assembly ATPase PilB-like protein